MTKAELIKALEPFDDHADVFLAERKTDFDNGLLNSVKLIDINFSEDPDGETLATQKCIVLNEE